MYGQHFQQSMDQPGMVANPARGQLNRENEHFPVAVRAWEFGLARRVRPVPSRVSLLILHTQAESGADSRYSSRFPRRRPFIYLKPPYAIRPVPSLSYHAIAYRWHSLRRVRRHRASSPQGSSRNGCCLLRYHHGPIFMRPSFPPHPLYYTILILVY